MQRWNVLVVDDDQDVLQAHGLYFESMGHQVAMHSSPLDACEYLKRGGPIDLLVTDFMMPDMNGLELVKAARNFGYVGPILMISAYQGDIKSNEASRFPLDLMTKPVRYCELVEYMNLLQMSLPIPQALRMDAA